MHRPQNLSLRGKKVVKDNFLQLAEEHLEKKNFLLVTEASATILTGHPSNSATLPGPETFLKRGPIDDRPEPWVVAGISGIGPILIDYSKMRPPTTIRIGPKIQAPG